MINKHFETLQTLCEIYDNYTSIMYFKNEIHLSKFIKNVISNCKNLKQSERGYQIQYENGSRLYLMVLTEYCRGLRSNAICYDYNIDKRLLQVIVEPMMRDYSSDDYSKVWLEPIILRY